CPAVAARRGDALLRRVAGDARIRALLYRLRQRLPATLDRTISRAARARTGAWRLPLSLAADDLGWRDHHRRDRHSLSRPTGRIGPRRRRDLRRLHRASTRAR